MPAGAVVKYMRATAFTGIPAMINRPALVLAFAVALAPLSAHAEPAVTIPPPASEASAQSAGLETAVLAGGCFWASRPSTSMSKA